MLHNDARKLFSIDGIEFADASIGHVRARHRCGFEFDEVPPTGSLPGRNVNELLWIMRCGDADGTQIAIPMIDDEESRSEPASEPRKVSFSIIGSCSMWVPYSKYSEPRMLSCGGVMAGGGDDGGTWSSEFFRIDPTLL
jgi:hypothetical protein